MASASAMPQAVSSTVSGTSTVSEGPSRLVMMCETGSPVLQALPKSKLRICLTKIHSWTVQGWSSPSWARMLADPVEQQEHQHDDTRHGRQHLPQAAQDISKHPETIDQITRTSYA
jgi:hypothetical protein